MGSWDKTKPTTATAIVDSPTFYSENWEAISNGLSVEHYAFTSALCGIHYPGYVSTVLVTAASALSALGPPATGALAWDSTNGILEVYQGSWDYVDMLATDRVVAYISGGDADIPLNIDTVLPFNAESLDSLNSHSAGLFTALANGYYSVSVQAYIVLGPSLQQRPSVWLTLGVSGGQYEAFEYESLGVPWSVRGAFTTYCPSGDTIFASLYAPYVSITVSGGASLSYITIQRVS